MTTEIFQEVQYAYAGFSSVHHPHNTLFDHRRKQSDRLWMTANHRSQGAEGVFDGIYAVNRISLRTVVSQYTTDNLRGEIFLQMADGRYTLKPVYAWEGANIQPNHSTALERALGMPRTSTIVEVVPWNVLDSLDLRLRVPVEAVAIALRLRGHGVFWVEALTCFGAYIGQHALSSVAAYKQRSGYDRVWVAA